MSEVAQTELWVGSLGHDPAPGLRRYQVRDTSLRLVDEWDLTDPGWLEASGNLIWAAQHTSDSALVPIDPLSGAVGVAVHTGDADACHLALSPGGEWAALAHYTSGSVSVFSTALVNGGATLLAHRRFSGHSGKDASRQEAPHAHHIAWLDEQTLLVCDLGADLVRCLIWDPTAQVLAEVEPIVLPAGFGPRHLVVRQPAQSRQIAVAGELSGQVASFETAADQVDGWRSVDLIDGTRIGGSAPSGLRMLSQNKLVMANRMIDTLAFLTWRDDATLILSDEIDSGGVHARDLVAFEGRLWVAHQGSDEITVLAESSAGWKVVERIEVVKPAALLFTPSQS